MKRAVVIVLDSVGIGYAPDASEFGDSGANTVRHIREKISEFSIPELDSAGFPACEALAAGKEVGGSPTLSFGCLTEQSAGKDTTTGHWELMGSALSEPFATFDRFPESLVAEMEAASGVEFIGNYSQSGTVILDELGEKHVHSGKPILYTSADSVIQIAAHEEVIPLEHLYGICRSCRVIADRERIGRVIARPFLGRAGAFQRTSNRHDFSLQPPETVLNRLKKAGVKTTGVGKISDIFAGSGISESHPTVNNKEGCEQISYLLSRNLEQPELIFANLVDFDMLYGHRRDVGGYAAALQDFDQWFGENVPLIDSETLLIITADHGNDPTWTGTDHTRERVPLLVKGPGSPQNLCVRESFADVAASLSQWFGIDHSGLDGVSFIQPG